MVLKDCMGSSLSVASYDRQSLYFQQLKVFIAPIQELDNTILVSVVGNSNLFSQSDV